VKRAHTCLWGFILLGSLLLAGCVPEVGVEWVQWYSQVKKDNIKNRKDCAEGFYDILSNYGDWVGDFNKGNSEAHEEHFKRESKGGTDSRMVDAVDFVYFAGHGAGSTGLGRGSAITFGVNAYDDWILSVVPSNREPQWGDRDLEFIVLDACSFLARKKDGDGVKYTFGERIANTSVIRGVHYIMGFRTYAHDDPDRGQIYAEYLTGTGSAAPSKHTIGKAWMYATELTEWGDVSGAYVRFVSEGVDTKDDTVDDWCLNPDLESIKYVYNSWPCH